jgi:hypothetical protein
MKGGDTLLGSPGGVKGETGSVVES